MIDGAGRFFPGVPPERMYAYVTHLRPRVGENRGFAWQRAGRYLITRSPAKCAGGVRNVLLVSVPNVAIKIAATVIAAV